ncbi:MAG: signal peptidase II [Candidatus Dependentiae bacterium]|jgi:signal peptidase II
MPSPQKPLPRRSSIFFLAALSAFVIDRLSKMWAVRTLSERGIQLFPGFSFDLSYNTGISFSLFSSSTGSSHWALTLLVACIVAALVIIWRFASTHTTLSNLAYGMIIGGAVGNFYDRIHFRGVIDFIHWSVRSFHWPTFNLADFCIVLGFCFLLIEAWHDTQSS